MSRLSLALVVLLAPATLCAQEAFAPLESGLKVGQKVSVLADAPCAAEPCPGEFVKGKITRLTESSIVVHDGRRGHELSAFDVRLVERPKDRIWNGVLAGFGVGFVGGFVAVMSDGCEPGQWCILDGPSFAAAFGLLTGGVGAGIGALTDAAISGRRVVFHRAAPARVSASVAPIVGPRRGGVRVSLRF
jgi:hypothetical protein